MSKLMNTIDIEIVNKIKLTNVPDINSMKYSIDNDKNTVTNYFHHINKTLLQTDTCFAGFQ